MESTREIDDWDCWKIFCSAPVPIEEHPFAAVMNKFEFTENEKHMFKPLYRYFKNIKYEDLFSLYEMGYELSDVPEPNDRLLMVCFGNRLYDKIRKIKLEESESNAKSNESDDDNLREYCAL